MELLALGMLHFTLALISAVILIWSLRAKSNKFLNAIQKTKVVVRWRDSINYSIGVNFMAFLQIVIMRESALFFTLSGVIVFYSPISGLTSILTAKEPRGVDV